MNETKDYKKRILEYILKLLTSQEAVKYVTTVIVHTVLDKKISTKDEIRKYFNEAIDTWKPSSSSKTIH